MDPVLFNGINQASCLVKSDTKLKPTHIDCDSTMTVALTKHCLTTTSFACSTTVAPLNIMTCQPGKWHEATRTRCAQRYADINRSILRRSLPHLPRAARKSRIVDLTNVLTSQKQQNVRFVRQHLSMVHPKWWVHMFNGYKVYGLKLHPTGTLATTHVSLLVINMMTEWWLFRVFTFATLWYPQIGPANLVCLKHHIFSR